VSVTEATRLSRNDYDQLKFHSGAAYSVREAHMLAQYFSNVSTSI
jgi:hypothetical protein